MKDISISWKKKYLALAKHVASWSKDPRTKVGAVAVGEVGQILATGYNGFPRNIRDTEERLFDRELKYKYVVHAEQNCIYNATHNGISLQGATLFVSGLHVCRECAKGIIQVGITRVVVDKDEIIREDWIQSLLEEKEILEEAGVELCEV